MRRALFITALTVEFIAVREHLANVRDFQHPSGSVWELGEFRTQGDYWEILVVECGKGNTNAATETVKAIQHFNPDITFFVGIAGGLKPELKHGDVIAGSKIYGYEFGKEHNNQFLSRPEIGLPSYLLAERVKSDARKDQSNWSKDTSPQKPTLYVGPIVAGNKVLADAAGRVLKYILRTYSDALAIEMESEGFHSAVRASGETNCLVVRGISDLVHDKNPIDDEFRQPLAARNAAKYAFHLLQALPADDKKKVK
jgi:nucleoside phosphorylase